MGRERFNIRQFLIITSSHARFASLRGLCRILLIAVGGDPGVLRELGVVKNCTATSKWQRIYLNRTCERVSWGRFGQDNRIGAAQTIGYQRPT